MRQETHEINRTVGKLKISLRLVHHHAISRSEEQGPLGWQATLSVAFGTDDGDHEPEDGKQVNFIVEHNIVSSMDTVREWFARLSYHSICSLVDIYCLEVRGDHQIEWNKMMYFFDSRLANLGKVRNIILED